MKMKFYGFMLVLFSLVLVFAGAAGGNEKAEGSVEPLIVAMELQFPPFEMAEADGTPTGISVDTAYALGEYLGRPVVIENTAWTGLIPSIQSGKADLIISSMSINEEREKVIDFSIPYANSGLTLLINSKSSVKSYRDLSKSGVKVAVKSGTTGAMWAQENVPSENIQIFDEVAACALEVSQGKVDAFIYDGLTTFEMQKKFPDSTKVNLENLPGTLGGWGMAMKEGREDLKKQCDAFIVEYRNSGGFEKLEKKYLGEIKSVFDEAGLPSFFSVQE